MSNAIAGVGAQVKRGDGASSETFTAIAEVRSIRGPGMTRDVIEVTNLDSTGGWKEFIASFRDGGELNCTANFTLDGYDDLFLDFLSDDAVNFQVVLPDTGATTFDFAGLVTQVPLNIDPADAITFDFVIKITGQVSLTT